jgi:hypothetical protein
MHVATNRRPTATKSGGSARYTGPSRVRKVRPDRRRRPSIRIAPVMHGGDFRSAQHEISLPPPPRPHPMEERDAETRNGIALVTLVLLELAMILGNEWLVLGAVIAAGLTLGIVIRAWWMVPLAPVAFLALLSIHVRIFGWMVYVAPVDQHMAGFVYFWVTVILTGTIVVTVLIGTIIGKLRHRSTVGHAVRR